MDGGATASSFGYRRDDKRKSALEAARKATNSPFDTHSGLNKVSKAQVYKPSILDSDKENKRDLANIFSENTSGLLKSRQKSGGNGMK